MDSVSTKPHISYPAETPSAHDSGVFFPALVNDRRVGCIVTHEALQDIFHCTDGKYLQVFSQHRSEIEAATTRVIAADPKRQPPYIIGLGDF